MGKRGPQPKPQALALVDGTRKSRLNDQQPEPEVPDGVPRPPDWLSEVGAAYWRDLAPQLLTKGVLTTFDLHGLAVLCQALDLHQRASMILNGEVIVTDGKEGKVRHVALTVQRDQAYIVRQWSQEFGLTPSSRSGIKVPERVKQTEARRLLSG